MHRLGEASTKELPESVEIVDAVIDEIPIRVYRPKEKKRDNPLPGLVYYHGGGFSMGTTRSFDDFLSHLVQSLNIIIVSVE